MDACFARNTAYSHSASVRNLLLLCRMIFGIWATNVKLNTIKPSMSSRKASGPDISRLPKADDAPPPIRSRISPTYSINPPSEDMLEPKIFIAKLNPIISSTIDSIRLKVDRKALIELFICLRLMVSGFLISFVYMDLAILLKLLAF